MTFLEFCYKQYLAESDREQFGEFLGSVAGHDRPESGWYSYFRIWMQELEKRKAAKNNNSKGAGDGKIN